MSKINNDMMWAAFRKELELFGKLHEIAAIDKALNAQGLEYNDGFIDMIKSAADKAELPFKWYLCTQESEDFTEGKIYKVYEDDQGCEWITDDTGHSFIFGYCLNNFRLATDEEILSNVERSGENCKETAIIEDLEEAVNAYIGHPQEVDECSSVYGKRQAFKAGAQWERDKLIGWLKREADYIFQELKKGNKAYGLAEQYRAQLYKEVINKIKDF